MLQHEQESPTDELIYPLIKLQQLTREVCDTYQSGIPQINASHPERFNARLEEWWTSLPADFRCAGKNPVAVEIYLSLTGSTSHANERVPRCEDQNF